MLLDFKPEGKVYSVHQITRKYMQPISTPTAGWSTVKVSRRCRVKCPTRPGQLRAQRVTLGNDRIILLGRLQQGVGSDLSRSRGGQRPGTGSSLQIGKIVILRNHRVHVQVARVFNHWVKRTHERYCKISTVVCRVE
jgi:hypothetical protein